MPGGLHTYYPTTTIVGAMARRAGLGERHKAGGIKVPGGEAAQMAVPPPGFGGRASSWA